MCRLTDPILFRPRRTSHRFSISRARRKRRASTPTRRLSRSWCSLMPILPPLHAHSLEVYVRVTYGQILRDSGAFTDAETAFASALEKVPAVDRRRSPDDANILRLQSETKNNLGILYLVTDRAELAQQAFAGAREDFKRTLEISPDSVAGYQRSWLGIILPRRFVANAGSSGRGVGDVRRGDWS